MAHGHLVVWGRHAFKQGISLAHIENHMLRNGMNRDNIIKALHDITAIECSLAADIERLKKLNLLLMLILAAAAFAFIFINFWN